MTSADKFHEEHYPNPKYTVSTRREFLARSGGGFGLLSLAALLRPTGLWAADAQSGLNVPLHFPAKAKHVIHIFLSGGPTHVDTFDHKPALEKFDGKSISGANSVGFASPFKFQKCGQSGLEISEVFPELQNVADDLCVVKSMHTDIPAHESATLFMNTGNMRLPRPSMGSWVLYGLGSMNDNLPGFISLREGGVPTGGTNNWASVFLPGKFQGTSINASGNDPTKIIENLRNQYVSLKEQRRQLDLVKQLDQLHKQKLHEEAQLEAEIASLEMAFRMQTEAADVFDLRKESSATLALYGLDDAAPAPANAAAGKQAKAQRGNAMSNARKMVLARRLVEKGVRFVQVWCGGWDMHSDIVKNLPARAQGVDGPIAGLIRDLKAKGLFESTLVVINGEFGRTPGRDRNGKGETAGRDHHHRAFFTLLAGGGVKSGFSYGMTDDVGMTVADDKVHVHDLHATILRLLGYDHQRLTYRYNGREFRLTDVAGKIVPDLIA
jgi:DNA-binding transcriptional MerR regulator